MKVSPIRFNQIQGRQNYAGATSSNSQLNFYSSKSQKKSVSFQGDDVYYVWKSIAQRVLNSNSAELQELGEYFHKSDKGILETVTGARKFFIIKGGAKSQRAYKLLSDAVNNVKQIKSRLISRISELGPKEAMGLENISEQKTNLQHFFINPVIAEKQGLNPPIDDGILIYGTSKGKDSFINWLKNAAPVNYKEMQFNEKTPVASLEELVQNAKNGKTIFDLSGQRTLLNVKDIDKFLADFDTPEKRGNIGHFKAFAETLSNDYHTTIITKTDLNPETFESAAFERFGIPVELKDGISKSELEELKSARSIVKRMNDRADMVYSKFQEERHDYGKYKYDGLM